MQGGVCLTEFQKLMFLILLGKFLLYLVQACSRKISVSISITYLY